MRRRCLSLLLIAVLALLLGGSGAAQTPQMSADASAHLAEINAILQQAWLHRSDMDWQAFQQRVLQRAAAARSIPETYDAIRLALNLLADRHSYYVTSSGENITQSRERCVRAAFVPPQIPADVGYVRVQITPPTSIESIQHTLRMGDGVGTVGWIVDLRDSRGGNMWPALAGLGPLLGDGTAGFFVGPNDGGIPWGYSNGAAWSDTRAQVHARVETPYEMQAAGTRVAVLTDIGVSSSGEAIAIAFRGRPNTRSFGAPTCGLSTATQPFKLSSGAQLVVVTAVMADRTAKQYGGPVVPDEVIAEPDVVSRALAWLHER
jgi:hypothetical protein